MEREPQMLAAATRLFAEHGFNGVSMEQIATESGITKPMLYAYFDSKEGLYVACIERAARALLAALDEAIDPGQPPERQLWHGLLALFGFVADHRDAWRALLIEGRAHGSVAAGRIRELRHDLGDAITALLMRAARGAGISDEARAEAAIQARALIGSAEALADWWVEQGAPAAGSRDLLALRLMNFAWMGFGDLLQGNLWLPRPSEPDDVAPPPDEPPAGAQLPMSAAELAGAIRRMSDEDLRGGLRASREPMLDEIFARMPEHVRVSDFERPAVIEWRIRDEAGEDGERWQLVVESGGARVERGGDREPSLVLELGAVELLRLITGELTGPELFLTGRLRVEGDLLLAARLPGLFRLP